MDSTPGALTKSTVDAYTQKAAELIQNEKPGTDEREALMKTITDDFQKLCGKAEPNEVEGLRKSAESLEKVLNDEENGRLQRIFATTLGKKTPIEKFTDMIENHPGFKEEGLWKEVSGMFVLERSGDYEGSFTIRSRSSPEKLLIKPTFSGLKLLRPKDEESVEVELGLYQTIKTLEQDAQLYLDLQERGHPYYKEKFSLDRCGEYYLQASEKKGDELEIHFSDENRGESTRIGRINEGKVELLSTGGEVEKSFDTVEDFKEAILQNTLKQWVKLTDQEIRDDDGFDATKSSLELMEGIPVGTYSLQSVDQKPGEDAKYLMTVLQESDGFVKYEFTLGKGEIMRKQVDPPSEDKAEYNSVGLLKEGSEAFCNMQKGLNTMQIMEHASYLDLLGLKNPEQCSEQLLKDASEGTYVLNPKEVRASSFFLTIVREDSKLERVSVRATVDGFETVTTDDKTMKKFTTLKELLSTCGATAGLSTSTLQVFNILAEAPVIESFVKETLNEGVPRVNDVHWQLDIVEENYEDLKSNFPNIGCPTHTACTLKVRSGEFVAANFIDNKKFIFAGYPKTTEFFTDVRDNYWQLMWEQDVKTLVNLSQPQYIMDKIQASLYWLIKVGESFETRDGLTVTLLEETPGPGEGLIIREFEVKGPDGTKQTIKMLHLPQWKDRGAVSAERLLEVIDEVSKIQGGSKNPILIHCLAGVGRTGALGVAYKMVEIVRERIANDQPLGDILKEINDMIKRYRRARDRQVVQTPEQYQLILKTVALAIKGTVQK